MIDLIQRRRAMMGASEPPIPYQEVEYLQSAGLSTYINTGVNGGMPVGTIYRWEAKLGYATSSNRKFPAAFNNTSYLWYCEINVNGAFGSFLGNQSESITTPYISPETMHDVYMQIDAGHSINSYVYVNGGWEGNTSTYAQGAGPMATMVFCLFRLDGTFNGTNVRIGRNRLLVNGDVVRDFVPVRVGTTGYMYDRVSGQLFGNVGNSDFVLGNDK